MLSSISNYSNASSAYASQSAMSRQPKVPAAIDSAQQKRAPASNVDVYESSEGTVKTRAGIRTEAYTATEQRENAERLRRELDAKANEEKIEKPETPDDRRFREMLHKFVGQVLFGEMLKSMRATQEQNPYFGGGRAEEIFQQQLDMVLTDELTKSSSRSLSDPMYRLMKAPKFVE